MERNDEGSIELKQRDLIDRVFGALSLHSKLSAGKYTPSETSPLTIVGLPSTNDYFCVIVLAPLQDGKKRTPLGETIPTRNHLSSTNQNWQNY